MRFRAHRHPAPAVANLAAWTRVPPADRLTAMDDAPKSPPPNSPPSNSPPQREEDFAELARAFLDLWEAEGAFQTPASATQPKL